MINAKQIGFVASSLVRVGGFAAAGNNDDVTSVLSAALAIAGRGGVSVPVQASQNENAVGIISGGTSLVQIQRSATGEKIASPGGNEVYGRLSEPAGGGYLLSYFVLVAGTETPFIFAAPTAVDFDFGYRFDFARLPADFAIVVSKVVNNDPRVTLVRDVMELLTVTALNVLSPVSARPTPAGTGYFILYINEATYCLPAGFFTVDVDTKIVTWLPVTAKFNLESTDRVVAFYSTLE